MEFEPWMRLVVAVLAVWRVTHLLAGEDGPADLIVKFRALLGESLAGKLMDCFYCLSIWIAAPAALFVTRRPLEWLMSWLALSGGACLLENLAKQPATVEVTPHAAGREIDDVLRFETRAIEEQPGYAAGDGHQNAGHPTAQE